MDKSQIEQLFPGIRLIKPPKNWIPDWVSHPSTKHQRAYLDFDVRRELRLSTFQILERCSEEIDRRITDIKYLTKGEADRCIKMFRKEINKIGTRG